MLRCKQGSDQILCSPPLFTSFLHRLVRLHSFGDTPQQTIPYVYSDANWKDKLTSYNGQAITYDAIGNPLNDGTWTYEWQAGRQLKRMSKPGMSVEFKYDHNGLRTRKIVTENGVSTITNYTLLGKRITHMSTGNEHLHFFYDKDNQPIKVNYNGSLYTYVHNLQGDIIGILDNIGAMVIEYKYDVWGRVLSVTGPLADTLGKNNPFLYRGYVYDRTVNMYYGLLICIICAVDFWIQQVHDLSMQTIKLTITGNF